MKVIRKLKIMYYLDKGRKTSIKVNICKRGDRKVKTTGSKILIEEEKNKKKCKKSQLTCVI